MKFVGAILCDAATVREGLLHILGGGLNNLRRPAFPAPLGAELALLASLERSSDGELIDTEASIRVVISHVDDVLKRVAEVEARFKVENDPGSFGAVAPLVFPLSDLAIPTPGNYQLEVSVGDVREVINFSASLMGETPTQ
ncbi:hypothetical protein ITJ50_00755 [Curtobacterium sp. VKM Ac-2889]|uniref:DUF6941 family protein n=1 Tax=unclassified Curtobacterium TaxID=257496 RepID=UPI00188C2E2C|nr:MULTISPECIES: hypothetical protein [unclassified Curtobacterium]MBF4597208.1 hypothetical protein [Curtobacterium sp. VKM Ac-1796]MBF4609748.1 hypothetical protein [Curtobacterium sp. VKM Ac-2889]